MLKQCVVCSDFFKVKPSHYSFRMTCGKKECKSINMSNKLKGRPKSEKHREKIIKALIKNCPERSRKTSIALTGKQKTIEHRKNLSIAHKGKVLSEQHKINIGIANKGKKNSEKQKMAASKTMSNFWKHKRSEMMNIIRRMVKSRSMSGPDNPAWKGGISFELYSKLFNKKLKNEIKKRDNFTCQNPGCNKTNNFLHIHHINYKKNQNSPLNLITLCRPCHTKTNFNRNYWMALYFNIILYKYDNFKKAA